MDSVMVFDLTISYQSTPKELQDWIFKQYDKHVSL